MSVLYKVTDTLCHFLHVKSVYRLKIASAVGKLRNLVLSEIEIVKRNGNGLLPRPLIYFSTKCAVVVFPEPEGPESITILFLSSDATEFATFLTNAR